jgi:hypothetical protein
MERTLPRAREYFERFTATNAAETLQALVLSQPKAFEDEQLDFKHGEPRDEDVDSIWSKALGAFANSQGGVVIWRIKPDRDNELKLDFAHSLALVPDIYALREKLIQKYRFLTDSPLGNVEVVPIPLREGAKEGFVVCYVPEGNQKAHRSMKAKYPYYFRIGSDAVEISNSWLRQLFYPQTYHNLSLHIGALKTIPRIMRVEGEEMGFGNSDRCVSVGIKNDGDYSLYEAVLIVKRGRNLLINWEWERFKRGFGRGHFEDAGIRLASPLPPTLRSIVNLLAFGNDKKQNGPFGFAQKTSNHLTSKLSIPSCRSKQASRW